MINCDEVVRFLSGYIDDDLSPNLKSEIEAHFDVCSECKKQIQQALHVKKTLRNLKTYTTSKNFELTLRNKISNGFSRSRNTILTCFGNIHYKMVTGIVISIFLILILFSLSLLNKNDSPYSVFSNTNDLTIEKQEEIIKDNSESIISPLKSSPGKLVGSPASPITDSTKQIKTISQIKQTH